MNKDTNLIFEAYKKRLTESHYIPSTNDIQATLNKLKSRCSIEEVKAIVNTAIQHYRPTSEDDLKSGLYEDYQDAVNHSPMGEW